MRKITATLLILAMVFALVQPAGNSKVEAAGMYITVNAFVKSLAVQLKVEVKDKTAAGYISSLTEVGIIKDGDFTDYEKDLIRGDMLMLLSRADEYLNGTTVNADLVQEVIKKRISDIGKVPENKKEDIAKGFVKGYLKGYSNGAYSSDRNLKLTCKIVKKDALNCIKMLTDKSLRAKISPDGQLLRRSNLPNNAYMFPYILDSYPNRYYEAKLRFEGITAYYGGNLVKLKSPEDYTYPKNVFEAKVTGITNFNVAKAKFLDTWMDKIYTRVWNTFNVNYNTIDKEWVEVMAQTDSYIYDDSSIKLYKLLNRYVEDMKANKTIVECNKVSMDGSSLYYYNGFYYIRCYVHYRILSTKTKNNYSNNELNGKIWGPYNCLLFSRSSFIDLAGYKLKNWVDGVFDVGICTGVDGNDGSMYGVCDCDWSPSLFPSLERN
jgi:hypothetical protein